MVMLTVSARLNQRRGKSVRYPLSGPLRGSCAGILAFFLKIYRVSTSGFEASPH